MKEAFVAQVSVEIFQSRKLSLGQMQAIMRQQLLPPMDCLRMEVSLESRQGTQTFSFLVLVRDESARMLMTWRSVKRDLLMSMLSLASLPSVPVDPILSEPAKSTSYSLLLSTLSLLNLSQLQIRIVRIEWLRELCTFSLCDALILFFSPAVKYFRRSYSLWHSKMYKFYTLNCSSLFHLNRSPAPPLSDKPAGFSRSQILSLQICRKDMEIANVRYRCDSIIQKRLEKMRGMMPESRFSSSPCIVQVFPEPVCPQAKMVEWQPLRDLSMRWSMLACWQSCSWVTVWSKMQSKLKFLRVLLSRSSTSLRVGCMLMWELLQPFLVSVLRKGRMRMAALILLAIIKLFSDESKHTNSTGHPSNQLSTLSIHHHSLTTPYTHPLFCSNYAYSTLPNTFPQYSTLINIPPIRPQISEISDFQLSCHQVLRVLQPPTLHTHTLLLLHQPQNTRQPLRFGMHLRPTRLHLAQLQLHIPRRTLPLAALLIKQVHRFIVTHIGIFLQLAHELLLGFLQILAEHFRIEPHNDRTELQPGTLIVFGRQQRGLVALVGEEGEAFGIVFWFVVWERGELLVDILVGGPV